MEAIIRAKTNSSGSEGFTLIEVLIAILVFTIGVLAVSTMSIQAFNGFDLSRTSTAEVNRAIRNIDSLKSTSYFNNQIFNAGGQGASNYPFGDDQGAIGCWDFNNMVVRDVKFIAVENSRLRGPSPTNNYRLYFTKEGKLQIN